MKKVAIVLILFTLLAACHIYNHVIVTDVNSSSLKNASTFAWLPDATDSSEILFSKSAVREQLRNNFNIYFNRVGFHPQADTPTVLVQLGVFTKKISESVYFFPSETKTFPGAEYNNAYAGANYAYSDVYCYPAGYCAGKISYFRESVSLNIIDRKQNVLIWSGTVEENIYDTIPDKAKIKKAVNRIMKAFPVKR